MSPEPDYVQTFNAFWRPRLTDERGRIDMDKVMRELYDYRICMEEASKTNDHIACGQIIAVEQYYREDES